MEKLFKLLILIIISVGLIIPSTVVKASLVEQYIDESLGGDVLSGALDTTQRRN